MVDTLAGEVSHMFGLGVPELLIIVAVVLLLFGYKKLPDATRAVGRSLRIFRGEIKGMTDDDVASKEPAQTARGTLGATDQPAASQPGTSRPDTSQPQPPAESAPPPAAPSAPPSSTPPSSTAPATESTPPAAAPAAERRPDLER
jgi:sec-independent protein translocase protein TatA